MFCSECGTEADGKFCYNCGSPLHVAGSTDRSSNVPPAKVEPELTSNWEDDPQYEHVISAKVVRDAIVRHSDSAVQGFSAEDFLKIYGKIVPSPVPYDKLAPIVQSMYASWGVKTGQQKSGVVRAPIGVVIARALCSLAKNAQPFKSVNQADEGCTLIAEFPSSLWAMKGEIRITITLHRHGTHVDAATNIPGQMFDWGASNKTLERLFEELRTDMGIGKPA